MTLAIQMGPVRGRIRGDLDTSAQSALRFVCSYEVQNFEHILRAAQKRGGGWAKATLQSDGRNSLYNRGTRTFPIGLLPKVQNTLEMLGLEYEMEQVPVHRPKLVEIPAPSDDWKLWRYQEEALTLALSAPMGMLRVATGGGKTVIAGHIMHQRAQKAAFFVHTKDLLYQALESFTAMFGEEHVGMVGDGVVAPKTITVCMLQTFALALGKKVVANPFEEDDQKLVQTSLSQAQAISFLDSIGTVIMDECHRVAAPTAQGVISSVKHATSRYGLSASPWRDDGLDIVLEGIFGPTIVDIPASRLIVRGYLVPPIIRMMPVPPMDIPKGTDYATAYRQYIVENDERNQIGVDAARRMMKQGRQTLVLVRYIEHGEQIAKQLGIPFLSGFDSSTVRRDTIQALRDEKLSGIVATTIADEGLDIKPLSGLVLLAGGKSSTRALQRVGRVLRPFRDKVDAEVIDFDDNARYFTDHSIAREKLYGTETAFTVTDW